MKWCTWTAAMWVVVLSGCVIQFPEGYRPMLSEPVPVAVDHSGCDHDIQHLLSDVKATWDAGEDLEWPIRATVHLILDNSFVEYWQRFNETPESMTTACTEMLERIFPVFERDLRLILEMGHTRVWTSADPYSAVKTADGQYYRRDYLVSSVASWAAQEWGTEGAVVICFSAKRMDGGAVGVASGTACQNWGAGITPFNQIICAHEIAHQFFIGHDLDNEPGGPYIMARSAGNRNKFEFSPRSFEHLSVSRVNLQCLEVVVPEVILDVPFMRGDVNGDLRWNITDVNALFQYLFNGGTNFYCDDACDVNDDGSMNITDVQFLFNYLFGSSPKPIPPPPLVAPGHDPTEDNLGCPRKAAA